MAPSVHSDWSVKSTTYCMHTLMKSATPKHNTYFEFSNVLATIHFVAVQKSSNVNLDNILAISDWKHGSKYRGLLPISPPFEHYMLREIAVY